MAQLIFTAAFLFLLVACGETTDERVAREIKEHLFTNYTDKPIEIWETR